MIIKIKNIQHIDKFDIHIDITSPGLHCIVGKNGVGKTTLIKCIRNFSNSETFTKTSPNTIFTKNSEINYSLNGENYTFSFEESSGAIEYKGAIPNILRSNVDVELPIPHGNRFNFFQTISDANSAIVKSIAFEDYKKPSELIDLLNTIYSTNKFDQLIEVKHKKVSCYALLLDNERYIREDYLSSGEFFVISLYRKIKNKKKLIVIDEIDISLDASAQVVLVKKLREYCDKYSVKILFTTHSLALMRTLLDGELYYLTNDNGLLETSLVSYNFVKSVLFGFEGWDKYILTEDQVLQDYLEYLISNYCDNIYYRYKIIYVGGGTNVVDLMKRNMADRFLSTVDNVISILDGDQRNEKHVRNFKRSHCIPQESVEKYLLEQYRKPNTTIPRLADSSILVGKAPEKILYKELLKQKLMSKNKIHEFITNNYRDEINTFVNNVLKKHLCK
ncbi:ATP-dependent nuclease [Aliivibrio fischeri]|uniref:ATP-dependent nuclease n=1 Tax=Aliivibrio fischeri TaxID=668 RepID=UPI0007C450B3|nr:AAA family ATPase [Aliivibrio fischeri]